MQNILKKNYTVLLIFNVQDEIDKIKFRLICDGFNFNFISLNSLDNINEILKNNKIDLIIHDLDNAALDLNSVQNAFVINVCNLQISLLNEPFQWEKSSQCKIFHIIKDAGYDYLTAISEIAGNFVRASDELFELKLLSYATRSIRDCIYVTDMFGIILYVNQAFTKIYGYCEDDIIGCSSEKLFKKILSEKDIEDIFVHSSENGWLGESVAIKKDGTEFEIAFSISYVYDDRNEIIGLGVIVRDITEIKKLQKKIKENEERYKQMFEKHFAIKLLIDFETGSIIDANQSAANFYGYDIETLKKMKITQINMESYENTQKNMQIADSKENKQFYFKHRLASGEIKDVSVSTGPIIIDDKKYLYSIITDITDKLKQEKTLRETEAKYATIFENTGTAMLILDFELTIILANKEFEYLSGYAKSELENKKKFLDFVAVDDIEKIKEYNNLALINNMAAPGSYKFQFIDINNNIKEILLKITLIANTNERIASLQDISESEKQKKELMFEESRLESLLKLTKMENSSVAELLKFALDQAINLTRSRFGYIATVDEKEDLLFVEAVSKMTEERFKISQTNLSLKISENGILKNVIKNKCHLLLNSPGRMIVKSSNFSKLHSWFSRQIILPVIDSQQTVMIVCIANKWDEYDHSDVRQLHLLMEETWRIIKQKKSERAIKEANLKLMELDKLKNTFLSNVSHELRTPLTRKTQ